MNNGNSNKFAPDELFSSSFELYPEEMVQGKVAMQGGDIYNEIFPQIRISVSYASGTTKKAHTYLRTVTYQSAYTEKIIADVHWDTKNIDSSLGSIARAVVRTANYLDGEQVTAIDELIF